MEERRKLGEERGGREGEASEEEGGKMTGGEEFFTRRSFKHSAQVENGVLLAISAHKISVHLIYTAVRFILAHSVF